MLRQAYTKMGAGASNLVTKWVDDSQSGTRLDKAPKNDTVAKLVLNTKVKVAKVHIADDMEAEDKGHQEKDEDTLSMDSKDSDDTDFLALRITRYVLENRKAMQNENMEEGRQDVAIQSKEKDMNIVRDLNKPENVCKNGSGLGLIGKGVKFEDKNEDKDRCNSAHDGTLAKKMPTFLLEKRQRMQSANLAYNRFSGNYGQKVLAIQSLNNDKDGTATTIDHTDEVENVMNDDPEVHDKEKLKTCKVVDTTDPTNDEAKEDQTNDSVSSARTDSVKTNPDVSKYKENGSINHMNDDCVTDTSNSNKTSYGLNDQKPNSFDQFEEFKRKFDVFYKRRKSVANKQTLILTKVGTKFELMTVPAYLPNQRLYRSTSFVKNYIPFIPVIRRKSKF